MSEIVKTMDEQGFTNESLVFVVVYIKIQNVQRVLSCTFTFHKICIYIYYSLKTNIAKTCKFSIFKRINGPYFVLIKKI